MSVLRRPSTLLLTAVLLASGGFAACSNNPKVGGDGDGDGTGDAGASGGDGDSIGDGDLSIPGDGDGDSGSGVFSVEPEALQTITVDIGSTSPTASYEAFLNGSPIAAGWSVDRGEIGSVTLGAAQTGVFTPTGRVGGTVVVSAALNGDVVEREIVVELRGTQNGADPSDPGQAAQIPGDLSELTAGGGPGGVGGEGLGVAVTDDDLLDALDNPGSDGAEEELALVYPYDGTVFPRGILAPLVSWDWSLGDADAVKLELATESGNFEWSGTFGRPAILDDSGGAFVQHPIPQNVWSAATSTAAGTTDRLVLSLTVASGGEAYGPLEQTWTIAEARLAGTIYYNSYGTNLAKNSTGAVGGDGTFGGATLGIRVGDTGPTLVAGATGTEGYCRVCHSVSADGSRLVSSNQSPDSFAYDLAADGGVTETPTGALLEFPAVYPDGSMALSSEGELYLLPEADAPLTTTGLDGLAEGFGTPMFSSDGTKLAFNAMVSGADQTIVVVDFDFETLAFTSPVTVVDFTGQSEENRPGWPAFFPDGNSLVFHSQTDSGLDSNNVGDLRTRKEARAQIHWVSATASGEVTPLNQLNGMDSDDNSYLAPLRDPIAMSCTADGDQVGDQDQRHEDDVNLNYEPTVNPVGGGGYAWVVFTSRRRYGNVATIPPFCSDPRGVDLIENITPKKLWVAAVDLNAEPGTDSSHPAFYLPGQELLAGNSRAFWVLDPCKANDDSCETGDQCCGGFCQPDAESGELVCSNEPPDHSCSELQEKCQTSEDCCDDFASCLGGFCTQVVPR